MVGKKFSLVVYRYSSKMMKILIILFSVLTFCCCDHSVDKHKDHHHGHHHYYDLFFYKEKIFWYFVFLAFKIKAVFVLGTVFTVSLVVGKVFALVKYIDHMKKKEYHHHEEKVVYVNPHDYHSHHDSGDHYGSFSAPSAVYQAGPPEYNGAPDQPPPGNIEKNLVVGFPEAGYSNYYGPMQPNNGRKFETDNTDWSNVLDTFSNMIRMSNISDVAFEEMGIKTERCKKRFVCETDSLMKQSIVFRSAFEVLSDKSYEKYRSHNNLISDGECEMLYPECSKNYISD